jgi:endonuclease YncB( thermonuclease family)
MLKRLIYLTAVFCSAVSFSFSQTTSQVAANNTVKEDTNSGKSSKPFVNTARLIEGKVNFVYDGDTIRIESKSDKQVYIIRLQGIDAPEDRQNYGKKSRNKLADLILDKDVHVVIKKKDVDDRFVGSVYYANQDINLRQIETGMAWHNKRYANELNLADRKLYAQAELKARAERIGLWEDKDPTPPWDYKKGVSSKKNKEKDEEKDVEKTDEKNAGKKAEANPVESSGKKYIRGPRGGCYYINESGGKTYVKDKSLCEN